MKERLISFDYLRAFACVLVTIGHLIMSFQESNIVNDSLFLDGFIKFIYCFHVHIFFYCSGYLFQKSGDNKLFKRKSVVYFRLEKFINFMILYVFFSGVTYLLKVFFSSEVNSEVEYSFFSVLINHPINQMWYLYAIALIFLFAHLIRSDKSAYSILGVSVFLRVFICFPCIYSTLPISISYICRNMIWFVLGQVVAYKKLRLSLLFSLLLGVAFIILFIPTFILDWDFEFISTMLTFLGVLSSVGIISNLTENKTTISGVWKYVSKYMLQIYLLHTMCAACVRIVLFKLGITHIVPHLLIGLCASFVLPILCAIIAEKVYVLNIVFFPTKVLKNIWNKKDHSK